MTEKLEKATFGAGCFWCVEAVFQRIKGVESVVSGYTGGTKPNPTYDEVCSSETGHAEVIQITFNPKEISYEKLLDIFWESHDPTSLNRQGADVGTQYRSMIFYHNEKQKKIAEKSKAKVAKEFDKPIATQIEPLEKFYPAENYHQNYYNRNKYAPYCLLVIRPKLKKLKLS